MSNRSYSFLFRLASAGSGASGGSEEGERLKQQAKRACTRVAQHLEGELGFDTAQRSNDEVLSRGAVSVKDNDSLRDVEVSILLRPSPGSEGLVSSEIDIPDPEGFELDEGTCGEIASRLSSEIERALTGRYPSRKLKPVKVTPLRKNELRPGRGTLVRRMCG